MNVKSISAALNCLIRSVALTFVNDNQSLELATKAAVSRHGREAIVMYMPRPHARHAPGGGLNLNFDIACRFGHTALRCSKHHELA